MEDLALNQVRFHNVKGNDADLVARLDYEFNQKVVDLQYQPKPPNVPARPGSSEAGCFERP